MTVQTTQPAARAARPVMKPQPRPNPEPGPRQPTRFQFTDWAML